MNLVREPKAYPVWKAFGSAIDQFEQLDCLFPHDKTLETKHAPPPFATAVLT